MCSTDGYDRLIRERENMFPFANIQNSEHPVGSSPFMPSLFKPSVAEEVSLPSKEEGRERGEGKRKARKYVT